ncbi:uncharacterized protein LOC141915151 [Tubulanus polymorphus]|uniref:uncharacterized protein LOC141915151 n=1 Tax=Tubulanus polymorphus TaxID=672921 RepID=UPI003DA6A14A
MLIVSTVVIVFFLLLLYFHCLARQRQARIISERHKRNVKYIKAPVFTTTMAESQEVHTGSFKKFECQVVAYPVPEISWYKDNIDITYDPRYKFAFYNGVCSCLIEDITPRDQGLYKCEAVNSEGIAATSAYLLVRDRSHIDHIDGTEQYESHSLKLERAERIQHEQENQDKKETFEERLTNQDKKDRDQEEYDVNHEASKETDLKRRKDEYEKQEEKQKPEVYKNGKLKESKVKAEHALLSESDLWESLDIKAVPKANGFDDSHAEENLVTVEKLTPAQCMAMQEKTTENNAENKIKDEETGSGEEQKDNAVKLKEDNNSRNKENDVENDTKIQGEERAKRLDNEKTEKNESEKEQKEHEKKEADHTTDQKYKEESGRLEEEERVSEDMGKSEKNQSEILLKEKMEQEDITEIGKNKKDKDEEGNVKKKREQKKEQGELETKGEQENIDKVEKDKMKEKYPAPGSDSKPNDDMKEVKKHKVQSNDAQTENLSNKEGPSENDGLDGEQQIKNHVEREDTKILEDEKSGNEKKELKEPRDSGSDKLKEDKIKEKDDVINAIGDEVKKDKHQEDKQLKNDR